jgi:hypothetical protein
MGGRLAGHRTPDFPYTEEDVPPGLVMRTAGNAKRFHADVAANRPSAGEEGRFYLETDTDRLLYDTGNTWRLVSYNPLANVNPYFYGWVDVSVPEIKNGPSGWGLSRGTVASGNWMLNHGLNLSDPWNLILVSGNGRGNSIRNVQYYVPGSDANTAEIFTPDSSGSNVDGDFQFAFLNTEYQP